MFVQSQNGLSVKKLGKNDVIAAEPAQDGSCAVWLHRDDMEKVFMLGQYSCIASADQAIRSAVLAHARGEALFTFPKDDGKEGAGLPEAAVSNAAGLNMLARKQFIKRRADGLGMPGVFMLEGDALCITPDSWLFAAGTCGWDALQRATKDCSWVLDEEFTSEKGDTYSKKDDTVMTAFEGFTDRFEDTRRMLAQNGAHMEPEGLVDVPAKEVMTVPEPFMTDEEAEEFAIALAAVAADILARKKGTDLKREFADAAAAAGISGVSFENEGTGLGRLTIPGEAWASFETPEEVLDIVDGFMPDGARNGWTTCMRHFIDTDDAAVMAGLLAAAAPAYIFEAGHASNFAGAIACIAPEGIPANRPEPEVIAEPVTEIPTEEQAAPEPVVKEPVIEEPAAEEPAMEVEEIHAPFPAPFVEEAPAGQTEEEPVALEMTEEPEVQEPVEEEPAAEPEPVVEESPAETPEVEAEEQPDTAEEQTEDTISAEEEHELRVKLADCIVEMGEKFSVGGITRGDDITVTMGPDAWGTFLAALGYDRVAEILSGDADVMFDGYTTDGSEKDLVVMQAFTDCINAMREARAKQPEVPAEESEETAEEPAAEEVPAEEPVVETVPEESPAEEAAEPAVEVEKAEEPAVPEADPELDALITEAMEIAGKLFISGVKKNEEGSATIDMFAWSMLLADPGFERMQELLGEQKDVLFDGYTGKDKNVISAFITGAGEALALQGVVQSSEKTEPETQPEETPTTVEEESSEELAAEEPAAEEAVSEVIEPEVPVEDVIGAALEEAAEEIVAEETATETAVEPAEEIPAETAAVEPEMTEGASEESTDDAEAAPEEEAKPEETPGKKKGRLTRKATTLAEELSLKGVSREGRSIRLGSEAWETFTDTLGFAAVIRILDGKEEVLSGYATADAREPGADDFAVLEAFIECATELSARRNAAAEKEKAAMVGKSQASPVTGTEEAQPEKPVTTDGNQDKAQTQENITERTTETAETEITTPETEAGSGKADAETAEVETVSDTEEGGSNADPGMTFNADGESLEPDTEPDEEPEDGRKKKKKGKKQKKDKKQKHGDENEDSMEGQQQQQDNDDFDEDENTGGIPWAAFGAFVGIAAVCGGAYLFLFA